MKLASSFLAVSLVLFAVACGDDDDQAEFDAAANVADADPNAPDAEPIVYDASPDDPEARFALRSPMLELASPSTSTWVSTRVAAPGATGDRAAGSAGEGVRNRRRPRSGWADSGAVWHIQ